MSTIFFILALACLVGVFGILVAGVMAMGKAGIDGRRKSNRLMTARVVMQALIVVFLLLAVVTY